MYYKKYLSKLKGWVFALINGVLPPRCPVSGRIVDRVGSLSAESWGSLTFIGSPFCKCCGMPFQIVEDDADSPKDEPSNQLCGPCLASPKPFTKARSVFVYDDVSRDLILAFKHGDHTHLTVTFAPLLLKAADEMLDRADVIIPVPLHWTRLVKRRYNQAALLARALASKTGIGFQPYVLKRVRSTPPQGHKSARDRHENVRKAFVVVPEKSDMIAGKAIVLVDDVYTTGATLEECTHALLAAGAKQVDVVTLARVVKSH
ncbi:MAG: ComF family protein [Alphaproteobacteria bacterium]|nr:ComF family protein [Alphaproteobacteria bacterium]